MNHTRVELDIVPSDEERLHLARAGQKRKIGCVSKV
jgi:hypothetical protein